MTKKWNSKRYKVHGRYYDIRYWAYGRLIKCVIAGSVDDDILHRISRKLHGKMIPGSQREITSSVTQQKGIHWEVLQREV